MHDRKLRIWLKIYKLPSTRMSSTFCSLREVGKRPCLFYIKSTFLRWFLWSYHHRVCISSFSKIHEKRILLMYIRWVAWHFHGDISYPCFGGVYLSTKIVFDMTKMINQQKMYNIKFIPIPHCYRAYTHAHTNHKSRVGL